MTVNNPEELNFFNNLEPARQVQADTTSASTTQDTPWAYELRPIELSDYFGQTKVMAYLEKKLLKPINHMVFWGPPGCGKTTLAHLIAKKANLELYTFNAVISGVKELRELIEKASYIEKMSGKKSAIFIDEIHRFNKAQQDALLPYLESRQFILLGATTEYPQTSLNRAIISRIEVVELKKLTELDLIQIFNRAKKIKEIELTEEQLKIIARFSNGDARIGLNFLESLKNNFEAPEKISHNDLIEYLSQNARHYDKNSNRHYDVISAFIKSVRGSDPDAAVLWLAIMIDGGEDPEFIARRLIILASEDIGLANPQALEIATNAHYAVKNIGMPEARIILSQATIFLAKSQKSNSAYLAIDRALEYVRTNPTIEVPGHLTQFSPEKKNYLYPHDFPNHYVKQNYTKPENKIAFYKKAEHDA